MRVLVTGGAGYVGSALIPELIREGHHVIVVDLFIYGAEVLPSHPNLICVKADIRDSRRLSELLIGVDAVIHLACISNDPSFELNPKLGKEINLDPFRPLVESSIKNGVKIFVYASSSSVYGIKEGINVTENIELDPITDYSKYKAECEEILNEYAGTSQMAVVTLRPSTVCGYAPRLRLDVVVNILTAHGFFNNVIKIFGGAQLRPNIHIGDMVRAYILMLNASSESYDGEVFNVGYQNRSVEDLADLVRSRLNNGCALEVVSTNDNRSYHVSSDKIRQKLGFFPLFTIEDAVDSLIAAFKNGEVTDPFKNDVFFNIQRMKNIRLI